MVFYNDLLHDGRPSDDKCILRHSRSDELSPYPENLDPESAGDLLVARNSKFTRTLQWR